ncbi:MAG: hypothetical protein HQ592_18350, partial [Planctomycetes bacterium]|nr:hypothetical protein [Planctomycetota bacterium]
MRTEIKDPSYKVFTYQDVDRVPDCEFGYWPQTIRRWLKEGLPLELTEEEQNQMFSAKLDKFFGFDGGHGVGVGVNTGMNPSFETKIIERKEHSVIMQDGAGVIAERYESNVEQSSIPRIIESPIKTPDDWPAMKERYRIDDPIRRRPADEV